MTRSRTLHGRGTRRIARSLAALALAAGAPALRAQESRVTVTPFVGGLWTTPLFQNDTLLQDSRGIADRRYERLVLTPVPRGGARIEAAIGSGWIVVGQGAYGRGTLRYTRRGTHTDSRDVQTRDDLNAQAAASATEASLQIGRHFVNALGSDVTIAVGGALHHVARRERTDACQTGSGECPPAPWAGTYDIPSGVASVSWRQPVGRRLGVDVHATAGAGRTNTASFGQALDPRYPASALPAHATVVVAEASIGLALRL